MSQLRTEWGDLGGGTVSKKARSDDSRTRRLRRLAIQIAGQLPENAAESAQVLRYMAELVQFMEGPDSSPEARRGALKIAG